MLPHSIKQPVRRLLTNRWQATAFGFASIAALSLIPKWWWHPDPHWSVLLVHDLGVALGLVFSVLAYYFTRRTTHSDHPPRPEDGREGDLHVELGPATNR